MTVLSKKDLLGQQVFDFIGDAPMTKEELELLQNLLGKFYLLQDFKSKEADMTHEYMHLVMEYRLEREW